MLGHLTLALNLRFDTTLMSTLRPLFQYHKQKQHEDQLLFEIYL